MNCFRARLVPRTAEYEPQGGVMATVDEAKLHQLIGQLLNDLGGAASVAMVRMGDALGLYNLTVS
jgi:hypothetical protein